MARGSNVSILMQDDTGLFIRHGTSKYRPAPTVSGIRKGQTVRAWPWSGGLKVELTPGQSTVWTKDS